MKTDSVEERRSVLLRGAAAWCALAMPGLGLAQGAAPGARKPAGTDKGWRLLVNEAVTGESSIFILTARYRPLAEYLSALPKVRRTIAVEPVVDIQRFLTLARSTTRPELVFGKSVNQLAKLVRDEGYQPVVRRADPYKAAFIVAKGATFTTLAEAEKANAKFLLPDESSATTAVARAELRRQNVLQPQLVHTRYQEAVAQQIQGGFAQVGVVNPTIARKWTEQGGRVLAETQPVVNWSLLASSSVRGDELAQLREAMLAMNAQPTLLAGLGVKEWAAADRQDYLKLLDYTKE
jgi:ABC-type phosphate/phosphonate transport system substrate-binding protein